ncbi:MAG TPA: hypothetical protein VJ837_05930 [Candidatus Paceibacterota bacterium]|nr:hypothetical protein [Candidatus Paceibacterota bacterium]
MFELISKLRQRSPEERKRISFWVAAAVTLFIACIWFVTLFVGGVAPKPTPKSSTPAQGLWAQVKQGATALIDSIRR